ncbi:MAG: hypothetical protein H0T89_16990 [Deltaproteobacteria bacterium]|nr:hypothetical protein [Deltaproteobacteria bacterium]MDQ3300481.1 hypothetical protein [Myxococcota bacterium]
MSLNESLETAGIVMTDEKKTRELCGSKHEAKRLRCMLPKGHGQAHESHTVTHTLTWK